MKIGEFLVDIKKITNEQLEIALEIQQKNPNRLIGDILIDLGYLSTDWENIKIGEILIKNSYITEQQLSKALEIQKKYPRVLIGEILIKLGFIDLDQLVSCLIFQLKYNLKVLKKSPGFNL